jgi:glutaredoxin
MQEIQVWGTAQCGWCKKACDLLDQQGFKYDYFDALENHQKFNSLFPNATTVPQIIFRGEYVGGYEGLYRTFEEQNIFIGGSSFV